MAFQHDPAYGALSLLDLLAQGRDNLGLARRIFLTIAVAAIDNNRWCQILCGQCDCGIVHILGVVVGASLFTAAQNQVTVAIARGRGSGGSAGGGRGGGGGGGARAGMFCFFLITLIYTLNL